jgi:hypothetical protein
MRKLIKILFVFLFFKNIYADEKADFLETAFQDVLLVIHYNHPHYQTIPFLKEIYSPIFPNIVFYGEANNPEVNVVKTECGCYYTPVVAHALCNYPGFRGYIFLQDDCFMNFWNYLRLDKDKIWFKVNGSTTNFLSSPLDSEGTWHFSLDWGLKALRKDFPLISQEAKDCYIKNHGQNRAIGEMCDMFYLPGKFSQEALPMCKIFANVFCEISIATMLSCLDSTYNWEKLNSLWTRDCGFVISHFQPTLDWVHPIKFSDNKYREFVKKQIEKYYYNIQEEND